MTHNGFLCSRFPTVERRARSASPSLYHTLPFDKEICDAVLLKCTEHTKEVRKERLLSYNLLGALLSGSMVVVIYITQ